MKLLTLLLALPLFCHVSAAAAAASPVAVGGAPDLSVLATFLGAMTVAAGLMRIRRRR